MADRGDAAGWPTTSPRCTAPDSEWGDESPNLLMQPPCFCPDCASQSQAYEDRVSPGWLLVPGEPQRRRVQAASLGERGRRALGES